MSETVLAGDHIRHGAFEVLSDDSLFFWDSVRVLVGFLQLVQQIVQELIGVMLLFDIDRLTSVINIVFAEFFSDQKRSFGVLQIIHNLL